MPGWMKHMLESRFLGEIINNLRYADDNILMAEREEELKRLLMRVKEETEKAGFKLNNQKTNIMASGPINSLVLSFLYGSTLTSIHDYWKNHSFDYTNF